MKKWLEERGYDLQQSDLHALFKQWDLSQEKDEFLAAPPGRPKISRHLAQYARFYAPQLTWRHRAVTYANAAGSLVVGYKNVHLLDEWRMAVKRALRGAAGLRVNGSRPLRCRTGRAQMNAGYGWAGFGCRKRRLSAALQGCRRLGLGRSVGSLQLSLFFRY